MKPPRLAFGTAETRGKAGVTLADRQVNDSRSVPGPQAPSLVANNNSRLSTPQHFKVILRIVLDSFFLPEAII